MSNRLPAGMDVEHFLKTYGDDAWSNEPFIYCCRQEPQIPSKYYYRMGAAGLQLFPDADRPYNASDSSRRGLSGRLQMYIGTIRPNIFKIFAAIRIKRQVVALPQHRTGEDEAGVYNITKGNMSAVRAAEMTMHHYLDADSNVKRYAPNPESELFQPTQNVEQLLENMRKVQGLQMLLFDARSWRDDPKYDGGEAPPANLAIRDTTARKTPARSSTDPSLVIRMSKSGIEQLRAGNQQAYARLMNLMREAYKEDVEPATTPRTTVRLTTKVRNNLQSVDPVVRATAAAQIVNLAIPRVTRAQSIVTSTGGIATRTRRSSRIAKLPVANRTRGRRSGADRPS